MQTKFRSFSWLFDKKIANLRSAQICCENSLKFVVPIVFNVANFRTLNSLALKIDFESSSENSFSSINDFESSSKLFALFRSFFAIANSMVSTAANIVPTGLTLYNQFVVIADLPGVHRGISVLLKMLFSIICRLAMVCFHSI